MDFPESTFLYNEQEFAKTPKNQKEIFIYEWLRNLEDDLSNATRPKLKACQKELTVQLSRQLKLCLGPPTRELLAKCFAIMYSVGDTYSVFETVNQCTEIIKNRDESPAILPLKLTAVACIGAMFEKLGRMAGGSCQETVQILIKAMKNAESQGRCEILLCLQRIMDGIGQLGGSVHKDVYKACRNCMVDRSMPVRCAAAKCALGLIKHASFMYITELETMVSTCLKALEGSNYDVRICVSQLLGTLMATTQEPQQAGSSKGKRSVTLEEVLSLMSGGFLRGGMGFLKGSGGELLKGAAAREVRVGVTQSYAILFNEMGGMWVRKNIGLILTHVLELLSNPKATNTHVDAVYSRRCISFILRAVLGRLLDDSGQIEAAKEICTLITKKMNVVNNIIHSYTDTNGPTNSSIQGMEEVINTQHVLICALQELGCLIQGLGTSALALVTENVLDHVLTVLLHPAPAAQLAAAWCLRCVTVAVPSQLTPTIDRCVDRINSLKASGEAVGGYTHALAALVGGVHQCPLGIPHAKGKLVFSVVEDLLKNSSSNPKLVLHKSKAGWVLLGALMTLGPSVVKQHLPRMLVLWTSAFPQSAKEFEQEKTKGDSFTWHVTLENRAGALCSMTSFVAHCTALVTPDLIRKLLTPLESCLSMVTSFPQIVKQHGNHLKASIAMIRLRMYSLFTLLPPKSYESGFHGLLRELVAEFTLAENPSLTTTSLLRTVCHKDDAILLGTWLQETDHRSVEEQLQPNSASGSGALEHDPSCVYERCPKGEDAPGPLPLGVAVIDASIKLFGFILPSVAHKHRSQLLAHFAECIKQAKTSRQQAIQTNILTAFLCALKSLAEAKVGLGGEDVRSIATSLVMDAVTNPDPIVRCAAGEALGRIAQVVGNPAFTSSIAQKIFEQLRSARDAISRTGHSVALGCLHRYVGGMGAGHHLNTSVSILLALSQDNSSTIVQVWALHALALIADSGGPMFRGYVEPTLSQVVDLALVAPPSMTEVHQCLGKALAALITSIGPELQGGSQKIKNLRLRCVVSCAVMQNHSDSLVQAEAINCLQQLHVFAPSHVNLVTVVRKLCSNLSSPHLLLRRASVACLRQLSQREAKEVCDHAMAAGEEGSSQTTSYGVVVGDKGLEGALFSMLDTETDVRMRSDIRFTLTSMLQTLAPGDLTHWLGLCRDVLSAAKGNKGMAQEQPAPESSNEGKKEGKDDDDEDEAGGMTINETPETHPTVSPRWPTRIFATECVRKIIGACDNKRAHIDLALARELRQETGEDFLVMHLQELVRMAFIAATAQSDQLKLEGLQTLQDVVHVFETVPDPDFPGHVLLEQFQAQVGAALRPAFAPDMPSDVTAMASEVCSAWIAGGIARDLNDVRRIQQLLVTKLSKFSASKEATLQLYNEAATTMEKLAILKAWAEVYIVAIKQKSAPQVPVSEDDYTEPPGSLLQLVEPELMSLSRYWLGALKDHALLTLPPEYGPQMPIQGGMFYSPDFMEQARPHYRNCWPSLVHATALWLDNGGFEMAQNEPAVADTDFSGAAMVTTAKTPSEINKDRFHLLVGICMESLCSSRSTHSNATVCACLYAFDSLLDAPKQREIIGSQQMLAVEMLNVLHRIMLTRDTHDIQQCVMDVVQQITKAMQEAQETQLQACRFDNKGESPNLGEEDLTPGKSVVFGIMEICMCVLTRQFPNLVPPSPSSKRSSGLLVAINHSSNSFSEETAKLVSVAVCALALTPGLCSVKSSVTVLPSVIYLITNVLREASLLTGSGPTTIIPSVLQAYKVLTRSKYTVDPRCAQQWIGLLRSTLATILDAAKADQTEQPAKSADTQQVDESVVMLALAIFILSAPKDVILAGNLLEHSMNVFRRCVKSADAQVQLKALQTLASIFQCPDRSVAVPFIQTIAPHIVMLLNDACFDKPTTESQLSVFIEATKTVELLIELTEEQLRVHLLGLLIPILVHFLLDNPSTNKITKSLHEHCLNQLMKIGPKYPQPFKNIMTLSPELKQQLEKAIRAHQASSQAKAPKAQPKVAPVQPSIKLRMDFSNFK